MGYNPHVGGVLRAVRERGMTRAAAPWTALAAWSAFVALTERWRPWGDAYRLQYGIDEADYERIARAAPGFPSVQIQTPHADRYPPHWLVGEVHNITGIGLHTVYGIATGIVLAAALLVVAVALRRFGADAPTCVLVTGVIVASAYPMRFLLDARGMLTDALFVLGVALAAFGAESIRAGVLVAGLTVATLGRQTGVPLAVVAVVAILVDPRWRGRRRLTVPLAVALPVLAYLVPHLTARSFADTQGRGLIGMSLLGGSYGIGDLAVHIGRCLIALAIPVALIALAWLRGRSRPLWIALALGTFAALQAVWLAPDWTHSEPRLAALGVTALALSAAPGLTRAGLSPVEATLAALGIAAASLHHLYTYATTGVAEWAVLVVVGAMLVIAPAVRSVVVRSSPRAQSL